MNAASFYVAFAAFDIPVGFTGALLLQGLVAFGVSVPSTPGYVGPFEAAIVAALALYGVAEDRSFSYAIAYHVTTFVPITLLGLWSLRAHRHRARRPSPRDATATTRPRAVVHGPPSPSTATPRSTSCCACSRAKTTDTTVIETLFCLVELADRLEAERRDERDVTIEVTGAEVGPPDDNLAVRAARMVLDATGGKFGVHLRLEKRIPVRAGLGGGSSDAAGALAAGQPARRQPGAAPRAAPVRHPAGERRAVSVFRGAARAWLGPRRAPAPVAAPPGGAGPAPHPARARGHGGGLPLGR